MGYETTYGYDKYGNRTTVTDNAGRTTTSTYNSIGTRVEKVSSGDSEVAYSFFFASFAKFVVYCHVFKVFRKIT